MKYLFREIFFNENSMLFNMTYVAKKLVQLLHAGEKKQKKHLLSHSKIADICCLIKDEIHLMICCTIRVVLV